MTTFTITPKIAQNIISLNASEYLEWADGQGISAKELENEFSLVVSQPKLNFLPKFNLVHKDQDFEVSNVVLVAPTDEVLVHFDSLKCPAKVQYSFEGILLQENSCDMNDLEDIKEMSFTGLVQCNVEGLYPSAYTVINSQFPTPF